jgi:two-component system NarL family sensor kinase
MDDRLAFTVHDDGMGFDPDAALAGTTLGMHVGLETVIERIRLAGGDVTVASAPGAGARFNVTVPAEPRADASVVGEPDAAGTGI